MNVFDALQKRFAFLFQEFKNIYISFSGGKDSGVLLNLLLDYRNKYASDRVIGVFHQDFEAQYTVTTDYITRTFKRLENESGIDLYWVCLPMATRTFNEANADEECAGVITWMHTFSPAKSWILGLQEYRKPLMHFHTQFNQEIPYDSIDMDFMNENQSAHGDREYGHMGGGCSGYEVYCGICECIFLAQSRGMSVKGLLDLEEMVSRILTYRMHDYDIPGVVSY